MACVLKKISALRAEQNKYNDCNHLFLKYKTKNIFLGFSPQYFCAFC